MAITPKTAATWSALNNIALNSLSSATGDSVAYELGEICTHLHSSEQIYGLTSNTMARKSVAPIVVTGGNGAWGTELMLHNGTVIESGSATKKFDLNQMYLVAVGTANRYTVMEFYYGTKAAGVTCTFTNGTEKVNKNTHGLSNGTKIMFSNSGGALPAELNAYTVYYVVNKTDNDFEVSLTSGGATINITDDGSGTNQYHTLTQTLLTETVISAAATNADAIPMRIQCPRIACENLIWARAWAAGGTNDCSFFLGLHIYDA